MGLFSSKTIIKVASTVYNMAGEEKDRPIFLKNLIIRNVLSGTKRSMGDTISTGYLNGPGIKFRSFYRWALEHYNPIGMPTGNMYAGDVINSQTVADNIPKAANQEVWVQEAFIDSADFSQWGERWMLANFPEELETEWEVEFEDATSTVTVTRANGEKTSFVAEGYDPGAQYLYALFTRATTATSDPVENGTPSSLAPGAAFPSVEGYNSLTDVSTARTERLEKTTTRTVTYSDNRPPERSTSTTESNATVNRRVRTYDKKVYEGNSDTEDAKISTRHIRRLINDQKVEREVTTNTQVEDLPGGVKKTTTTLITEDVLEANNSYRDDTQKIYDIKWGPISKYIYRIGSGNAALDALMAETAQMGRFFPMIPVRYDNKFLVELPNWVQGGGYALAKKAYRKATDGGKYDDLVKELASNKDLKDMDYIYVAYGVSLNVIDRSARRYIFEFFKRLAASQPGGAGAARKFQQDMAAYRTAYAEWERWRNRSEQHANSDGGGFAPGPQPKLPPMPTLPSGALAVGTPLISYDMRMYWNWIIESDDQPGLGRPGAKKNDFWIQNMGRTSVSAPVYTGGQFNEDAPRSNNTQSYDTIRIYWQFADNRHRYIEVAGLKHRNFVYGGKSVDISATEALADAEESGFLIPLHYATYRNMRLVDSTQMSTACMFLVINSYQKQKQKWWQKGIFKVLFAIVIAIVSVVFTGGAGFGLLGAHMAVGSSLGLTGMTAAIVGSVANALAALVLTTIISKLTEGLGPLGAILGAVIGIVVSGAIQSFMSGGGFNFNFAQLMRADNIMKLMDAAGQGYAAYVQASITDMQEELVKLQEGANAELRRIREAYFEQFGYGGGQIDPMMFIGDNSPVMAESRDTFLSRTLMTGSDVAQMSHDLLSDYVSLTTTLPNAFT